MLHRPLTVLNAEIKTAAVEIRTLTVSGKQITLAVFRQLMEEKLVNRDGSLNGTPWGTVNYHPDKCADYRPHIHVVWQRETDLLRSKVWLPEHSVDPDSSGNTFSNHEFNSKFYSNNGDAAMTLSIYRAVEEGRYAASSRSSETVVRENIKRSVPGLSKLQFESVQCPDLCARQAAWISKQDKTTLFNDFDYARAFPDTEILDLPERVNVRQEHGESWEEFNRRYDAANEDRTYGKILERTMQTLADICANYGDAEVAFKQELDAEVAVRQSYIKTVDELICLPQLFIAV